jgi:hypothetical protein
VLLTGVLLAAAAACTSSGSRRPPIRVWGEDLYGRQRNLAAQVDKILKGTNPSDIPVE